MHLEVAVLGGDLDAVRQAGDGGGDVEGNGGNNDLHGRSWSRGIRFC